MKINKYMFYISGVLSVVLLVISSILNFKFVDNYIISFVVNIFLNVFAGAIILFITSLTNYFIYRRNLLRDIMNECLKYSNLFSKSEYFIPRKYNEKDFKNIEIKDKKDFINQYKNNIQKDNQEMLERIIRQYVNISEISTRELWNMYDDLNFIFDFKSKKRKKYWNLIFNYIYSNIKEIKSSSYHFKIYLSANHGNYEVNAEYLCKLQDKIFFKKQFNYKEEKEIKDLVSNIDVSHHIIRDTNEKEITLIYNEVSDKLIKMFDMVGKDNYFSKKYSSIEGEINE